MKKAAIAAVLLFLSSTTSFGSTYKTVTLKELGKAVHILIELYQENSRELEKLKRENEKLKKKVEELEKKLLLVRIEQKVKKAEDKRIEVKKEVKIPRVEVVPGSASNPYPWITFKRSDVECRLPERVRGGYRYYNIFVTSSKEKALNLARNVARTGICSVVRRIRRTPPLYRVVVIPGEGTEERLRKMGFDYFPYVRDLDLTRSSGGEL